VKKLKIVITRKLRQKKGYDETKIKRMMHNEIRSCRHYKEYSGKMTNAKFPRC
jgi:hypothetical protein